MKYGKIIEGNVVIKADDNNDYSLVEKITGYFSAYEGSKVTLNALQTIGGNFYACEGSKVTLNALQTIGGYFDADKGSKVTLNALQTIGGYFYAYEDSKVTLNALQTIGGYFYYREGSKVKLNALQTIGGNFYYREDSNLILKNKININNAEAREFAFNFNFNCFLSLGFILADGILTKLISNKKIGNYTVYKTKRLCTEEIVYVVREGNVFSHGSTIKEAIRDLVFKNIKDKDLSAYKDLTLDSVLTFEEAIEMYHNVANSCREGIKIFIDNNNIEEKDYTVQEIIEKTKGQYNYELLVNFFEGK